VASRHRAGRAHRSRHTLLLRLRAMRLSGDRTRMRRAAAESRAMSRRCPASVSAELTRPWTHLQKRVDVIPVAFLHFTDHNRSYLTNLTDLIRSFCVLSVRFQSVAMLVECTPSLPCGDARPGDDSAGARS
jgi:hypothetical protein